MIYYNQELNFPYKYIGTTATPDGIADRPLWQRQFVRRGDQYKDIVSPSFKLVDPDWWDAHQYSNDFYINFFRPNTISFSTLMPYHIIRDTGDTFSYGESTQVISNTSSELKTFFCKPYSPSTPGYNIPDANHHNPFPSQSGGTINLNPLDGLLFFKSGLGEKYINAVCMDVLLYLDNDGGVIIDPDELRDMIELRLIHTGTDAYDWNQIMDGFTSRRKDWNDISDIKILYASDDHKYYVIRYYAEYNFVKYDLDVGGYAIYFYRAMTFMLTFYKTHLPERFHFICASYSNTFLPYTE